MAELERTLAQIDVDWPETPSFDYQPRQRRRWPLALAIAVVLAVAAAFAVPQSRGAILRFLHLGGETIERVQTLPPAEERALRDSLGVPITRADAEQLLAQPFAVRGVKLYRAGMVVSALLPGDVLLSELNTGGDPMLMKKYVGSSTTIQAIEIHPGTPGIWIAGGKHVFLEPTLPPRYAGNTLVWLRGNITYRLEGRTLTLAEAERLARTLS